jgi:hypothetical protein
MANILATHDIAVPLCVIWGITDATKQMKNAIQFCSFVLICGLFNNIFGNLLHSVVSMTIKLRAGRSGFRIATGTRNISLLAPVQTGFVGSPNFVFNIHWG